MKRLRMSNPQEIRRTIAKVAQAVYNGEIDPKRGNSIIFACNSALTAIRTTEQQQKLDELERMINNKQ